MSMGDVVHNPPQPIDEQRLEAIERVVALPDWWRRYMQPGVIPEKGTGDDQADRTAVEGWVDQHFARGRAGQLLAELDSIDALREAIGMEAQD